MTVGTRKEFRLLAVRDNLRHRRMSARMPVGWREPIDSLWQRESCCAVGDSMQPRAIRDGGIWWAARESPWRHIAGPLERGESDSENGDDYWQEGRQGT
jgi:hypothetical protein